MKITKRNTLVFILALLAVIVIAIFIYNNADDMIQGFKEGYNSKI